MGELLKVEDGTGKTTFGYDSKGRQVAETNALAIIIRSYDSFGRYSQCVLDPAYPGYPSLIIQYGYDIFNRLDTVTAIIGSETNTFTYSYIPGTTLISGYIALTSSTPSTILTVSKTYEPYRNLITDVSNIWDSTVISSFTYSNDSTSKRTARSDYYNGSTVENTFNFNARGETTNAVMNSDTYNYYFDDIGNRTTSSVNSVISTYTANQLNQYTAVRTNGIYRSISHDKDGNLRYDGYWTYSWNAENRPIDICHSLYYATNDDMRVQMKYDYRNRRVERKITKFRMTVQDPMTPFIDGVWDAVRTHKYIWDGWNIAAEIVIDHVNPMTNITYYTWGLDLSGTLQGAGGVGGLLAATVSKPSTTSTYYALADANGNVTEYVDDTGIVKAHYEYNACGEITAQSGILKDDFTHRFSTKPYDPETRLVQYQKRPLKPDLARWLSRDSIGIKGGLNEVGFVRNDGINGLDLLGMLDPNLQDYSKRLFDFQIAAADGLGASLKINVIYESAKHCCTGGTCGGQLKKITEWTFGPELEVFVGYGAKVEFLGTGVGLIFVPLPPNLWVKNHT